MQSYVSYVLYVFKKTSGGILIKIYEVDHIFLLLFTNHSYYEFQNRERHHGRSTSALG